MSRLSVPTFDTLTIASALGASSGGATEQEIQSFAYLSCLLALYEGKDVSWWTYTFTATEVGTPFSDDLRECSEHLLATGLLSRFDSVLKPTSKGRRDLAFFQTLRIYEPRQRYLSAACSCVLSLPLATIGATLVQDPQLRPAIELAQTRALLDETGMALLRPHLEGLREVLNYDRLSQADRDLMIPAVLWLEYLRDTARKGSSDVRS